MRREGTKDGVFKAIDHNNDGVVRKKDFDILMEDELCLNIRDPKYKKLMKFLQDTSEGKCLQLSMFLKCLEEDDAAESLLNDINNKI